MNILRDIVDILKKNEDDSHILEIKIASDGITIYLDYDPFREFEQKYIIPIKYNIIEDVVSIYDKEYKEKYQDDDYGIDYNEIIIIKDIMDYLDKHREEITDICKLYDFKNRYDEIEDNTLSDEQKFKIFKKSYKYEEGVNI